MYLFSLVAVAGLRAQAVQDEIPLLANCADPGAVEAKLNPSDPIQVRYALAGQNPTCYAVSAVLAGGTVEGYLLGEAHPQIAEFERNRRSQPGVAPYVPPRPPAAVPVPAKATPSVPGPASFAGLRAEDLKGRAIDLERLPAKKVVLYFWSPSDRRAVQQTEMMDYIVQQYRAKGVEVIGVGSAGSRAALKQFCDQHEVVWPQIFDSGAIARKFGVDPGSHYYVLDRERNVVTALTSATQVDAALQPRGAER